MLQKKIICIIGGEHFLMLLQIAYIVHYDHLILFFFLKRNLLKLHTKKNIDKFFSQV